MQSEIQVELQAEMQAEMQPSTALRAIAAPFVRDRFTWLGYLMLAYYAYIQASLGAMMPLLRGELGLNYTVTGLHLSAFALGMILAGLTGERVGKRFGTRATFWGGAFGMAAGAVLLTLGHHELLTIPSAFISGFIGSNLLVMIQSPLTDQH